MLRGIGEDNPKVILYRAWWAPDKRVPQSWHLCGDLQRRFGAGHGADFLHHAIKL
jgi:hypothetical protein